MIWLRILKQLRSKLQTVKNKKSKQSPNSRQQLRSVNNSDKRKKRSNAKSRSKMPKVPKSWIRTAIWWHLDPVPIKTYNSNSRTNLVLKWIPLRKEVEALNAHKCLTGAWKNLILTRWNGWTKDWMSTRKSRAICQSLNYDMCQRRICDQKPSAKWVPKLSTICGNSLKRASMTTWTSTFTTYKATKRRKRFWLTSWPIVASLNKVKNSKFKQENIQSKTLKMSDWVKNLAFHT